MRLILALLVLGAVAFLLVRDEASWADPESAIVVCSVVLVIGGLIALGRRKGYAGAKGAKGPDDADREFLNRVALLGFLARVALALVIQVMGWQSSIAPDEGTFHVNAWMLQSWVKGESTFWLYSRYADSLQVGYFYLVAGVYLTVGVGRIAPVLVNCAIGAAAAFPVFRIARDLVGRDAARWSALLVTFFPSLILWSALVIRDSLVVLVLLWVIAAILALRQAFTVRRLIQLVLLFAMLGVLRQYLFVVVALCVALAFALGRAGSQARSLLVGAIAILGIFLLMRGTGLGLEEMERASLKSLAMVRQYNASVADAAGSFRPEVDISHPAGALTYLPIGLVYFLFSPFPWQLLSAHQVFALPEMLLWYALMPFQIMGILLLVRTRFRDSAMLLFTIFAITILYALVEGNVGIIFRHRAQVIAPATILAGAGIAVWRRKRQAQADRARLREAAA